MLRGALALILALSYAGSDPAGPRIDAATLRLDLADSPPRLVVPFDNPGPPRETDLRVEVLAPDDTVVATARQRLTVGSGHSEPRLELPERLGTLEGTPQSSVLLYRLRYDAEGLGESARGIASVSTLCRGSFVLEATAFTASTRVGVVPVEVFVTVAGTGAPAAGVTVAGWIDKAQTVDAVSDALGHATLQVPGSVGTRSHTVRVTATRFGLTESAELSVWARPDVQAVLTADKPLYRPGETIRARGLVVRPGRGVVADRDVQFRIRDDERKVVFKADVRTSRLGVATIAWPIPERASTGDYSLEVGLEDDDATTDDETEELGWLSVRVARYELPQFTVEARAEKSVYGLKERAAVLVDVVTFAGAPVASAHVAIEGDDVPDAEGRTDAQGHARIGVDLRDVQKDVAGRGRWSPFEDVTFTVRVTDPVTRRTEERHFELRVSRDPLHVYLTLDGNPTSRLPLAGFVTVTSADGTPVEADVVASGELTGRVRTNRFGVARIEGAWRRARKVGRESSLRLEARTADGRRGFEDASFWYGSGDDEPELKLERERTLFHPGEPLRLRVSRDPAGPVRIAVFAGPQLLEARDVAAGREPLRVEFPADGRFSGVLDVIAFSPRTDLQTGSRVLYPAADGLRAQLSVTPALARPGKAATAQLRLTNALGQPVAGVVGLGGVDQALLDRVRTDDPYANLDLPSLEDDSEALGGQSLASLKALAPDSVWDGDLELAAAFLLRDPQAHVSRFAGRGPDFQRAFRASFERTADTLRSALATIQWPDPGYPTTVAQVESALRDRGVWPALDPWDRPFVLEVHAYGGRQQLTIQSPGPGDLKTRALDPTVVESWGAYVRLENRLRRALAAYFTRAHRAATSIEELATELEAESVDPASVTDLEGHPLRLRVDFLGRNAFVVGERTLPRGDAATVFTATIDLFGPTAARLEPALSGWVQAHKGLPRNKTEYAAALRAGGLRPDGIRDLADREVVVSFGDETRYSDRAQATSGSAAGSTTVAIDAVTETSQVLTISTRRSEPGKPTSERDLSRFRYAKGRFGSDREPGQGRRSEVVVSDTTGGLIGRVTDAQGSSLPGATIVVSNAAGEQLFTSDAQGDYVASGLAPGAYRVQVQMPGFTTVEVDPVIVAAGRILVFDAQLSVGALQETVSVAAEPLARTVSATAVSEKGPVRPRLAVTPRLREYFPEALLWRPELEIGADGVATAPFTLADNLTTWHLTAVASTENGRLATAAVDVVSAQPFYAELDPPQRLTTGDRVDLPVRVRNDLAAARDVAISLTSEGGLAVAAGTRAVRVPPNETRTTVFEVRATTPGPEARLTASAIAEDDGDRLARTLAVRPDGEERVVTRVAAFEASRSLAFEIPADAVAGSTWADVSIAPDLRALIAQAIEGSLQRPYGCAEQTISSAFPGLLLLELHGDQPPTPLTERARRYLELAVERLLSQRSPGGGIGYWSVGDPDLAVSAYALRFVSRARRFVTLPDTLVTGLRDFLVKGQGADGRWKDAALTAYAARALAELPEAERTPAEASIDRARRWLASGATVSQDPYALAGYALLLDRAADMDARIGVLARLRQLEKREARGVHWAMEHNTCFFGWGRAGRLETTGLVLQALQRAARPEDEERRVAALLYLLDQQDEFGVWWSSQATVSVLEALAALVPRQPESVPASAIRVALDGVERKVVDVSGGFGVPAVVSLGRDLAPGRHVVTLEGAGPRASLRVVAGYAAPWSKASGRRTSASGALRYAVTPSRVKAKPGENVVMSVDVDRAGFKGYGMMIAEVGLPPGAEVDRAALDRFSWSSGLYHYEVEPDRVILYLWPRGPVSRLAVNFRPRLAMDALSAPSRLYDYYNPDEEVRLPPHRFEVR